MGELTGLDAVTIDAYGTLVELVDPVPALQAALAKRGVERDADRVRTAFRAEVAYYRPRSVEGRDAESLAALRRDCASVFLREAGAELDPAGFTEAFVDALVFRPVEGALAAVERFAAQGLALAVVSNWDVGLREKLGALASRFACVVTSAEVGAAKPDPAVFLAALARLGVEPARALHIGDEQDDEDGARAAGMRFRWAPL
ncbi:MAG TPA: HAD-IA family hydrolase [Gaiellaceae bacterium]|nr:HAD-IA family hydrolase [Gaiellaceae bacterium]